MDINTSIRDIPRIGPKYQKKLEKLGIQNIYDLIFHFPHRYEDFSNIIKISDIQPKEICCLQGKIISIKNIRTYNRRMVITEAQVEDNSGTIKVMWFNQPYLTTSLKPNDLICLAGKVALKGKTPYLQSPSYEKVSENMTHTGRIIPVYPTTEGVSSKWLRYILKNVLFSVQNELPDFLPEEIRKKNNLLEVKTAIKEIHFPTSKKMAYEAKKRFSFEELFYLSLFILSEKMKIAKEKAFAIPCDIELMKTFVESLPFTLTKSQKKSAWQILKDIELPKPMNRLLEGDVGSGKTIVAVMAALNSAKAGFQTTIMAPTEILAKQHFKQISEHLRKFDLRIGLLTNKETKIISKDNEENFKNKTFLNQLQRGEMDVIIGTHSLIQDKISFENYKKKLGLVIVDEQHRFGIEQRAKLCKQKDYIPHLLSMSATPIPRTLALTIYGDLDLSIIDELPKGRKKIETKIIPPKQRQETYNFIREEIKNGRQAFVVCPRIEEGENESNFLSWNEVKAVKKEYEKLSKEIFPDLKLEILHGKMKPNEKEKIMKEFQDNKINILVSTSVIEVGIDIPNASVMMIEGSERFGLAQLHQFRGRVGRSNNQSYCFLFTDLPNQKTISRLRALVNSNNGFELAEKDLKLRGPGSLIGERQWGIPDLAMASLDDVLLVEKTRNSAKNILEKDPELKNFPLLKEKLKAFTKRIHLE